jgi:hypothetical protein
MTTQTWKALADEAQEKVTHAEFALKDAQKALAALVDQAKSEPGAAVATIYGGVKALIEGLDELMKDPHNLINHLKYTLVPAAFDREGLKTITTENGYRVTVSPELRASMVDKVLAFEWLKANGLEDLITPTVNASTLKAALRQKLNDDGIEPPSEAIRVEVGFTTSVTKVSKKP